MAEIAMTTKMVTFGGSALGAGLPPVLDTFVDAPLAEAAVKKGDIAACEDYPMYKRTGVVIPLATGIPALLAGIFGDKFIKNPDIQLFLLTYGSTSTVGGLINLLRGLRARQAAGIKMLFPDPKSVPKNTQLRRAPTYVVPPATPTAPTYIPPPAAPTAPTYAAAPTAPIAPTATGLMATFV